MSTSPITDFREAGERGRRGRSIAAKIIWSIVLIIMIAIVAAVAIGAMLVPRGLAARDALEQASPLANQMQTQLIAGDHAGAERTVTAMEETTGEARQETEAFLWTAVEWVPIVGDNLKAVRIASVTVDNIARGVLRPATNLNIDALIPQDGTFDLAALENAAAVLSETDGVLESAAADLETINRDALIDQVAVAIDRLDSGLDQANALITPLTTAFKILPGAVGAEGARTYDLRLVTSLEPDATQESTLATVPITATNGTIELSDTATPGTAPATPAADGSVTFDTVALTRLLQATGPVTLTTREFLAEALGFDWFTPELYGLPSEITLTSDNVVDVLNDDTMFMLLDPTLQDAFYAAVAGTVVQTALNGSADTVVLFEQLATSVDERNLRYEPNDATERSLLADTTIMGAGAPD